MSHNRAMVNNFLKSIGCKEVDTDEEQDAFFDEELKRQKERKCFIFFKNLIHEAIQDYKRTYYLGAVKALSLDSAIRECRNAHDILKLIGRFLHDNHVNAREHHPLVYCIFTQISIHFRAVGYSASIIFLRDAIRNQAITTGCRQWQAFEFAFNLKGKALEGELEKLTLIFKMFMPIEDDYVFINLLAPRG